MSINYKVLIHQEYNKLSPDKTNIGLLMMVKNEHKRIKVSLDSVVGHVECFIIYDTGSEDDTIEIIKNHCEEHKINLYLIQGEFENFSVSRNVSLEYADTIPNLNYCLLLDCNDELKGGEYLRKFAEEHKNSSSTGFLACQEWWSGNYNKYYNLRFIKAREGWRYRGSVHEWMKNTKCEEGKDPPVIRIPDKTVLYQDRTQDDDKSSKRFFRDKILLLKDHKLDPTEPRTVFYLAQTCSCTRELEDAFYYYKIRTTLEGFQEEKFHAFCRCGDISKDLKHPWYDTMAWYMKAFEHSQRVEPILKIVEHYKETKNWILAYTFADLACSLTYPEHSILFVDSHAYTYERWHNLSIVAYYVGKYIEGKAGCEKAIAVGKNLELDNNNLNFYNEKLGQTSSSSSSITQNKQEFIKTTIETIKRENPSLGIKKITKLANNKWKNKT